MWRRIAHKTQKVGLATLLIGIFGAMIVASNLTTEVFYLIAAAGVIVMLAGSEWEEHICWMNTERRIKRNMTQKGELQCKRENNCIKSLI